MNYLNPSDELWYPAWRAWRQLGRPKGQRPVRAPRIIPPRIWKQMRLDDMAAQREKALAEYNARQLRWRWWDKVSFGVAWSQRDPWAICSHIATLGGKQVWVQANPEQRARAKAWREAATHFDLDLLVWLWPNGDAGEAINAVQVFKADGLVINVEHERADWPKFIAELRAALPVPFPLGVWTTFWGVLADSEYPRYSQKLADPWVKAEFVCVPEAYMVNEQGPQPTLVPLNLEALAKRFGFEKVVPSFGIYRTGPETYFPYIAPQGPYKGYNWYLYEYYPGGA